MKRNVLFWRVFFFCRKKEIIQNYGSFTGCHLHSQFTNCVFLMVYHYVAGLFECFVMFFICTLFIFIPYFICHSNEWGWNRKRRRFLLRDIQLQAIDSCFAKCWSVWIFNLIDMFTCLFTVHNESMEMPNNFFLISKNIHGIEMPRMWNIEGI